MIYVCGKNWLSISSPSPLLLLQIRDHEIPEEYSFEYLIPLDALPGPGEECVYHGCALGTTIKGNVHYFVNATCSGGFAGHLSEQVTIQCQPRAKCGKRALTENPVSHSCN